MEMSSESEFIEWVNQNFLGVGYETYGMDLMRGLFCESRLKNG